MSSGSLTSNVTFPPGVQLTGFDVKSVVGPTGPVATHQVALSVDIGAADAADIQALLQDLQAALGNQVDFVATPLDDLTYLCLSVCTFLLDFLVHAEFVFGTFRT